ncbi:MAG TPA: hypothetical protein VMO26_09950 [Vicinamibacterales bacterium]|nr:hypothetical protein [Vicinamibacterales bacterium]
MSTEPILLIVRRGALRRFAALERKTSHLDVKVIWDRRQRTRRQAAGVMRHELRAAERRAPQPPSWQLADFTISVPKASSGST